jgi:hypothetical protein
MSTLIIPLLLVGVVLWLLAPFGRRRGRDGADPIEDEEELQEAEREVRDLGAHQDPEEGWQGDDWGPGAGPRKR